MKRKIRKGQKLYAIRVKKPKHIPLLGGYHQIRASNKEIALKKFKKGFYTQLKITGISEIK